MTPRQIRLLGDPVLREPAARVDAVDDEIRSLLRDMMETMDEADGVGLAAPQIGLLKRVIVVDTREEGERFGIVNPEILSAAKETDRVEEGCLSIPGLAEIVERPVRVVVKGVGAEGEPVRVEAEGMLARVLQHEIDHLDGVLFLDRVSPLKRRMLLKKWQKVKPAEEGVGS